LLNLYKERNVTEQRPTYRNDTTEYTQKKRFFKQIITLYGRKPVLEILQDSSLTIYRLHLAESNKPQGIINEICTLAKQRNIEVQYHNRQELSRISKNNKQDQGVCVDILCPQHRSYKAFLESLNTDKSLRLIALDRITNPQNLGMIIRSVCAGEIDGLLIPEKGCASIDSLVVKASAGTLFKTPLLHCEKLTTALKECQEYGAKVYGLSSHATLSIADEINDPFIIYILGNETDGISEEVQKLCDQQIYIPMKNHVESLNVAVTASLLAFKEVLGKR
jgi:23S rRNA (guanosine2251-2'-O)-methyltransferase